MPSQAEKLAAVEAAIVRYREFRGSGEPGEKIFDALREIAADIRAASPQAADAAMKSLDRRINDAKRAKAHFGTAQYDFNHLCGIGQELIGRWSEIRGAPAAAYEEGFRAGVIAGRNEEK